MEKVRRLDNSTKLKNPYTSIYDINGRKYTFTIEYTDGGVPYGFCRKLNEWGWLYDSYIQFKSGKLILAKRIS